MARVTYKRRLSYNTKSNQIRQIRTPGGKLAVQYVKKRANRAKCGDTGVVLNGMHALRPRQLSQVSKRQKNVTRAYGGTLCGGAVRQRIIRAFLIEEQKIVKKVLKAQKVQKQQ